MAYSNNKKKQPLAYSSPSSLALQRQLLLSIFAFSSSGFTSVALKTSMVFVLLFDLWLSIESALMDGVSVLLPSSFLLFPRHPWSPW